MSHSQNKLDFDHLRTLVTAAQKGDKDAYRAALELLVSYVQAIVRYKVGALCDVDDVVQECLIGIHRSLHTYHPSKNIKPWINAIIRYKTTDYFRAQGRRKEFAAGDVLEVTTAAPEPNSNIENQPDADQVWALVEQLPAGMREPVLLTKRDGLSVRDAAKQLGVSEVAVRKRLSRAYQKLAVLYEKAYRTEDDE